LTFTELRALWDFNDPAASERLFDSLLEAGIEDRAVVLTQKARAQGLQRRFDDARATLALARAFIEDEDSEAGVAYWIELGRLKNSMGNAMQARQHFQKALMYARWSGQECLEVDAAHMLGIVERARQAWSGI
jgi:tetratricopeptide (TPR) repeat protein